MEKKLVRPLNNKVISGVCGALGTYFEIDPVIIRIVFVVALFVFFPAAFLAYIILWIVIPQEQPSTRAPEGQKTDSSPTPPELPGEKKKPSGGGAAVSVFLAAVLIVAGVLFLFPGSFFWFFDIAAVLVAVFLFFVAFKLVGEMVTGKNYNIVRLSVAFVAFTYGVFIVLSRFNLFGMGIFVEYTKNLVPALLILAGVGIIFKSVKNKIPEIVIVSALLVFIGVYSGVNAPGSSDGFPGGVLRGFRMPHFGRWFQGNRFGNFNPGPFNGSISFPDGLKNIEYTIGSSAGNLNLSAEGNGFVYSGNGVSPTVKTNYSGGVYRVQFDNQASDTVLKIGEKPSGTVNVNLQVSAGSLNADLTGMELKNVAVNVNGGSANLKLGENVRTVSVRNNVGSTDIRVPKNATVRVRVEQSLAHLGIANEFKLENGVYIYRGGENKIDVTASVVMGNVEIGF